MFTESHVAPYVKHLSGDVFIDAGAFRGDWSWWLHKSFRQIHAIDPEPHGEFPDNCIVHKVALSDSIGELYLVKYSNRQHYVGTEMEECLNGRDLTKKSRVPTITLDSLEIDGSIDFLKIDVEGEEAKVLEGSRKLIAKHRPVMLIEIHKQANGFNIVYDLLKTGYGVHTVMRPNSVPYTDVWLSHYWLYCFPKRSRNRKEEN